MSETEPKRPPRGRAEALFVAGGIVAALGAASCCVLPFLFFTLGVSGAWIGNLTALAPFQPVFALLGAAFLVAGFYRIYRQPTADCAEDSYCAKPAASRAVKIGLWVALALFGFALAFPKLAALYLAK